VVKILQGNVVTQTMLGGLTTYPRVASFLQCIRAKNYENWLAVDKVIAKIIRFTFLAHPVCHNVLLHHSKLGVQDQKLGVQLHPCSKLVPPLAVSINRQNNQQLVR